MTDLDTHYLRVSEYARRFNLDESTVYKKIARGEIEAIRIGKTVRIPSSEVTRYLRPTQMLAAVGDRAQSDPSSLEQSVRRFRTQTGRSPDEYVAAWRSEEIEDTPENARHAIEALSLRAALRDDVAQASETMSDLGARSHEIVESPEAPLIEDKATARRLLQESQ